MTEDVLEVIEAAYRLELTPAEWLQGLGELFYRQLGAGRGLWACEYRIVDGERMKVEGELRVDLPETAQMPARDIMETMPWEILRKTVARSDCHTMSQCRDPEINRYAAPFLESLATYGCHDMLCLAALDPAGHGVYVNAWLPRPEGLSPDRRARWIRATVHVATALRLRRRLAEATSTEAEAVLTPAGKVEHADGEARLEVARKALRSAVQDVERARGRLRRSDPNAAVRSWNGLVSARWSLVDRFDSDGKRYVLAHRNEVPLQGPEVLTGRERQVLAHAALGHMNKLIAYDLGISASTVSVLLSRAARKLGTTTRQELLAAYRRWCEPGQ